MGKPRKRKGFLLCSASKLSVEHQMAESWDDPSIQHFLTKIDCHIHRLSFIYFLWPDEVDIIKQVPIYELKQAPGSTLVMHSPLLSGGTVDMFLR